MKKRNSVWQACCKCISRSQFIVFTLFLLLAMPASLPVMAKEISVKSQPKLSLEGTFNTQRVCFYQGQSYSLGAVIAIEGVLIECQPEKHFETNGALKWTKIEKKS
ncbi:YnjH family protein [Photobacterium sp. ZSDE20]|uniref:YnjH family protein n=1 Tax=Photobacterium pectinilyticum TaxID=2906793 RepID=A0ABT1N940_9GAMM|nr:DUF1496 domain-containing protein [Photobacterium sp. ZSDE20]MCQ1059769.1 YnjH family protein [Photobacterium sp. ZSDE20]MDD1826004.1 YnjH family protein [Photobacterium sp. ZSDE20]